MEKSIRPSDEVYEQALADQLHESQAMFEISQILAKSLDLAVILREIVDAATTYIENAEQAVIHLIDEAGIFLKSAAIAREVDLPIRQMNFKPGQGIAGLVISSGETINVEDIDLDPRYIPAGQDHPQYKSLLVAPVKYGQHFMGTLSVHGKKPKSFDQRAVRLLTVLGSQAAQAIEKAKLYADLHTTLLHEQAARAQLVQSEKLAALGRIVASVAHELNNPLQAIQNALYLINLEESLTKQAREDLQVALNEADRMAGLISRLRDTYRPTTSEEFQPQSLNNLITEIEKLLSTHLRHNNVRFEFSPDPILPMCDILQDQIKQVALNICLNAVESMRQGGSLKVSTRFDHHTRQVAIIFKDTGTGIKPEVLPNIFDPFVTTKDGGTGLGLAITYDIVQRHRGRIDVESEPGNGSTFTVWLPIEHTEE